MNVIFIITVMISFIIVISIYKYDVKEKIRNGCRRVVGVRQLDLQGRPFLVHILQEYDLRQLQRAEHLPLHPKKNVYLKHQVKR